MHDCEGQPFHPIKQWGQIRSTANRLWTLQNQEIYWDLCVTIFFINTWLWTRFICTMNNLWLTITLAWQSNISVCFYKWRQQRYFDKQHFCLQTIWCMVLSLDWHTCKRPNVEIIAILFARHSSSRKGILFWHFTSRNPSKTI